MLRIAAAHPGAHPQGAARGAQGSARTQQPACCRRSCSACIFGYAATYDLNHVPYAVLDRITAPRRRSCWPAGRHGRVRARGRPEHAGATSRLHRRQARAARRRRFRQDFERRLEAGGAADVQVIADGRNSNTAGTALGYVSAIVDGFNTDWRADHGRPGRRSRSRSAPGTTPISDALEHDPRRSSAPSP